MIIHGLRCGFRVLARRGWIKRSTTSTYLVVIGHPAHDVAGNAAKEMERDQGELQSEAGVQDRLEVQEGAGTSSIGPVSLRPHYTDLRLSQRRQQTSRSTNQIKYLSFSPLHSCDGVTHR